MIRQHDFNSEWWGSPVGIVDDPSFFELPAEQRVTALAPFAWVEHKGEADPVHGARIAPTGFFQTDVQLAFRIGLDRVPVTESLGRLSIRWADEEPFEVPADSLASFQRERFTVLPGATPERIDARYAAWAANLLRSDPSTCLEVSSDGRVQGWFLSRAAGKGLHLTLAMLRADASMSGHSLYHKALTAYASRGYRVGQAEFSATNTAVLNTYASLGARFVKPAACWMWIR